MKKGKKVTEEIEVLDFETNTFEEEKKPKRKKEKQGFFTRIKNGWNSLSTKQRVLIITISILVILFIIGAILYLTLTKEDQTKTQKKQVIVAKDNYRYEDGTLYFVVNNKDVGSYECKNKDKDLCYVAYETNDDDFDETKYILAEDEPTRSKIIENRYVFVYDNKEKAEEKVILYDIKEKEKIDEYSSLKTYDLNKENIVFVKDEDQKYGLLEFTSKKINTLIDFDYDYLGVIIEGKSSSEEKIVATLDNGSLILDYNGNKLTKTYTGSIKNYNNNYVKVMDSTLKYSLYDYQGTKISEGYKYIDLLDEYYLAVDDENKIKILGYDKIKYLEEGIELYNDYYVKTITKDINNKDVKTDYAYTYVLENKELTINVNNNGVEEKNIINLLEGIASKNFKFISYYNGSLYFYADEEKTQLINSYRCNNSNNITAEDSKLEVCTLASDTALYDNESQQTQTAASIVPVFNKRFVFIKDKNIINLVDLVSEKVIGTYLSINTFSDSTKTEFYLHQTTNQYIIAQNKNNKYGMLKLTENSITSVYNFEYDKLEVLKDYISAKKDNKYFFLDYNGNKVSFEFNAPIRNYSNKYIKILDDKKYYIYDFDGNLVLEDGYKYIELYDDFVALVDDANHLSINDYDANMLINEILKLSSTTYYNPKEGYAKAFDIKKEGTKLTITAATSQNTKLENTKDFVYDLKTKERIN